MGLYVASIAMKVPPRVETAEELAPRLGRNAAWIAEHTGVLKRHVADDSVSPAFLAAAAARLALAATEAPDLILYAGSLPQQLVPDTSVFVQRELQLDRTPSFSINQTCLSFVAALQVANGLLSAGSYRRILICVAELATRGRNFEEPESAALLGDGAAAAVVEYRAEATSRIVHCELETWSDAVDLCEVRAGVHPPPQTSPLGADMFYFHMHGPRVYRFVRPRFRSFIQGFLERAGCGQEAIDLVVPHQASGPGLRLLEQCGFLPERIVNHVSEYGNCVAASMPMALAQAVATGRVSRGDKVLLVGTAAGVSLGAALIEW